MAKPICSMSGREFEHGDGIWDEGEWISWEWINTQMEDEPEESIDEIEHVPSREGFPYRIVEHTEVFYDLVSLAERYYENTGRYLQIWGELGEMYAEIRFGLRRHGSMHPGSDGTIRGELVEVKTISPEKSSDRVVVKRSGNFEKLLIVKIDREFQFQAKLFNRAELRSGVGPYYKTKFGAAKPNE